VGGGIAGILISGMGYGTMFVLMSVFNLLAILIYHLIETCVFGVRTHTMLLIPLDKEEWDGHLTERGNGSFLTYAHVDSPLEEGIGSVVITPAEGPGVVRQG